MIEGIFPNYGILEFLNSTDQVILSQNVVPLVQKKIL